MIRLPIRQLGEDRESVEVRFELDAHARRGDGGHASIHDHAPAVAPFRRGVPGVGQNIANAEGEKLPFGVARKNSTANAFSYLDDLGRPRLQVEPSELLLRHQPLQTILETDFGMIESDV